MNDKIWDGKVVSSNHIISRAIDALHAQEWARCTAYENNAPVCNIEVSRWVPPPTGTFKCNIDTAFRADQNITGIGMCIRDEFGHFMAARTEYVSLMLRVYDGRSRVFAACFNMAIYHGTRPGASGNG